MDNSKLKNRPPFPFETIAAAIAFSPRLESVLCEARRLSELFRAKLILVHVGARTDKKESELNEILSRLKFDKENFKIFWEEGSPVDSILRVCKDNVVDLLLAGAVEKENVFRYYIGSVSREICRRAKCSVLILTEPSVEGTLFRKLVVNGAEHPKTRHTLATSLYFARCEKAEVVHVVREFHPPGLAMSNAESSTESEKVREEWMEEETLKISDLLAKMDTSGIAKALPCTVFGKTGFAISNFAKENKADLLVVNSPDHHLTILDRLFTHDIEFILAELPCNVLIVHSRVEEETKRISY